MSSTHIFELKIEFSWMHPDELGLSILYGDSLRSFLLAQQKVKIFRHAAAQLSLMHFVIAKTWIAVATCKLQCLKKTKKLFSNFMKLKLFLIMFCWFPCLWKQNTKMLSVSVFAPIFNWTWTILVSFRLNVVNWKFKTWKIITSRTNLNAVEL